MRIRNFLEHSNNLSSVNHLIIVVDQVSEVIDIAKKVKDFTRGRQQGIVHIEEPDQEITYFYSKKDYNDIYYICRNDLDKGNAEKLISMTGYNEYENDDGIMVGVGKCRIFSLISEKNPQLDIPF